MNWRKIKSFGRLFYRAMMTKKWWLIVLSTSTLIIVGAITTVMMTTSVYDLDSLKNMRFATSIYDHNDKLVTTLGDTRRDYVDLDKVKSQELIEAYVAVEDERYYNHNGADLKGFGRALAVDLLTMSPAEGASTITMQVSRNVILNENEKTILRKVNEIAIAYNLERKYTKKEILEAYLNYIYLGNEVRGIQMASKIYFDKDLTKEKLEPHEIALLAGLPKAPEGYNPYIYPDKAQHRRNVVLNKMAEKNIITEEECEKYKKKKLGVNKKYLAKHTRNRDNKFQAYKDYVLDEAANRYGLDSKDLVNGGYRIYTGMNKKAQLSLEKSLREDSFYQNHKELDAGSTMINSKTGEIAAIGGGRHYLRGYRNQALAQVQPGSSIKPITVYGPAVEEKGYNEYTPVSDAPYTINGWSPKNLDHSFHGTVPLKVVAGKSLNVSTVRLLNEVVGVKTGYEYAKKSGLKLDKKDRAPAPLALGGLTRGVSTLEMAQAYTAFANGGKVTEAHAITKIVDVDGNTLEPKKKVKKKQKVYSPQTAYTMSRILKYAVEQGTGQNARLADGRDVAGKTGTTQNSRESWFVGYTSEYVMATMFFNQNGSQVKLSGGEFPAKVFHKVMTDTLKGTDVSYFKAPSGGGGGSSGGGGGNSGSSGGGNSGGGGGTVPHIPNSPPAGQPPQQTPNQPDQNRPPKEERPDRPNTPPDKPDQPDPDPDPEPPPQPDPPNPENPGDGD